MKEILSFFTAQREFRDIVELLGSRSSKELPLLVTGLSEGSKQFFYASLVESRKNKSRPLLAVLPQEKDVNRLASALSDLDIRVKTYPLRDFTMRNISASHEFEHERLSALHAAINGECDIVLTVPDAAMQYTVPPEILESRTRKIAVGESCDIENLCTLFIESGYARVDMVESFESCTDAKTPGMIRVSFGIYNTEAEVDEFLEILPKAMEAALEEQSKPDADVIPEY